VDTHARVDARRNPVGAVKGPGAGKDLMFATDFALIAQQSVPYFREYGSQKPLDSDSESEAKFGMTARDAEMLSKTIAQKSCF
jgi:hypothetical protein